MKYKNTRLTIKVTRNDIDKCQRNDIYNCPINTAFKRIFKKGVDCYTSVDSIRTSSFTATDGLSSNKICELPQKARDFIRSFDSGIKRTKLKSFKFEVLIPTEWAKVYIK